MHAASYPSRARAVPLMLAMLTLLAAPLPACSTLESVARGTAELTGDATTRPEPVPFVKASRRGEPSYVPIAATASVPVRPVARLTPSQVKDNEAALETIRAREEAFAKRPAPPPLTAAPLPPAGAAAKATAKPPAKPALRTAPADDD